MFCKFENPIHSQIRNIYSKFFVLKKQEFEPYRFSLSQYLPNNNLSKHSMDLPVPESFQAVSVDSENTVAKIYGQKIKRI